MEGVHSRTDFDLGSHEKFSGKNIKYFDPELNQSYTPYVIETSIGVDRTFLSILAAAYTEEELEGGDSRVVLKLPPVLAPIKAAILPLYFWLPRAYSRPIRWPKPQQKTRPRPPLSNRRQAFPSRIPGLSRESSPTG